MADQSEGIQVPESNNHVHLTDQANRYYGASMVARRALLVVGTVLLVPGLLFFESSSDPGSQGSWYISWIAVAAISGGGLIVLYGVVLPRLIAVPDSESEGNGPSESLIPAAAMLAWLRGRPARPLGTLGVLLVLLVLLIAFAARESQGPYR